MGDASSSWLVSKYDVADNQSKLEVQRVLTSRLDYDIYKPSVKTGSTKNVDTKVRM